MKGQRSLLMKGAAWVSAGSVFANLLGFVSLIVLTRMLLPEDFGLVAIAASFAEIVAAITQLSFGAALIQRSEVSKVHFDTAWSMSAVRGVIVALILVGTAPFVANFYGDQRLEGLLLLLAASPIIWGLMNPKLVIFKRRLDFRQDFLMGVVGKVATFVVSVTIALVYKSYWALIAGAIAGSVSSLIMSYILIPYRPRVSFAAWRDLFSFSIWLTLGTWVQTLNWRSTPLLLGYFLPTALLGQQRVGAKLLNKSVNEVVQPIKAILFPAFSRLQDEAARLRGGYIRSQGTICLITFPIAMGFALLAEEIIIIAVGEKWLPAAPIVQILAVTRIVQSMQNVNALAMAKGSTKDLFYRDLLMFGVRWPLVLGGLYLGREDQYSMLIGAMLGQALAAFIGAYLNMSLIAKVSSISILDHARFVWRPLVSLAAMAAVVILAREALPTLQGWTEILAGTLLLIGLGAATYFGSLFVLWIANGRQDSIEKELTFITRDLASKAIAKIQAR